MEQLLHFLLIYQDYVFLAMFASLSLVAFVNFVHNPYAKQNRQLKRFNKRTLQKPNSIVWEIKHLPAEYQRQWRAYVNSRCAKPSTVFEFVKLRKKYLLWFVHFVAAATSIAYVVLAIILDDAHLFTTQVAFLLSSILVILIDALIGTINLTLARRAFGKFLHDLNTVTQILKGNATSNKQNSVDLTSDEIAQTPIQQFAATPSTDVTDKAPTAILQDVSGKTPTTGLSPQLHTPTTEPLSRPATTPIFTTPNDDVIEKTVQILRQKGLDNPRTAEEQRKLNIALNNLLQACCKHKA